MDRCLLFFPILIIFVSLVSLNAQISGNLTIGAGGNYNNFVSAITALKSQGVSGAVTFNVLSGEYEEQIEIPAISGVDSSHTITFQAQSGNASDVKLFYKADNVSDNFVLKLNSISYININNLTIEAQGTTYSKVIEILNESNHINFNNLIINGYESAGSSEDQIVVCGDNTLNQNLLFDNCKINEGSIGIYLTGISTNNLCMNNIIQSCVFKSVGYYGIFMQYQHSPKIFKNVINSTGSGINLDKCRKEIEVVRNKINAQSYSLYLTSCFGGNDLESGPGLIANNFITATMNYCVYLGNTYYLDFYNNSLNLTSTDNGASTFYIYNGAYNTVLNNIIANSGGGYAYFVYTPTAIDTSDFNDFYTTGTIVCFLNGNRPTLKDLQIGGRDTYSISINPEFRSNFNLHTFAEALDSAGTPLASVTDDIDGDLRDAMYPDIGADEFDSTGAVGIEEDPNAQTNLPKEFMLYANYPNPFNPSTTINYDLPKAAHVSLEIFNILGQRVKVLVDQNQPAGRYSYKFDAASLSSGMYFYRIRAGQYNQAQKMILQR